MAVSDTTPSLRPRERLLRFGANSLTLAELWMCIIGSGTKSWPVARLAHQLVVWFKQENAHSSSRLPVPLGPAQTARVLAVGELLRRMQQLRRFVVNCPTDVQLLCQDLVASRRERVLVFYCASDATLLHREEIAVGTWNTAQISPRDVFYPIRWQPVESIIICHNHPSGNEAPSGADIVFTRRMAAACQLMGVTLRDHIILAAEKFYSFRASGLLDQWVAMDSTGKPG